MSNELGNSLEQLLQAANLVVEDVTPRATIKVLRYSRKDDWDQCLIARFDLESGGWRLTFHTETPCSAETRLHHVSAHFVDMTLAATLQLQKLQEEYLADLKAEQSLPPAADLLTDVASVFYQPGNSKN